MALSRSMKNLMHDAATARKGGGNTRGGMSGMLGRATQQVRDRYNPGGTKPTPGGNRGPRGPVMRPGGPSGPVMPRGGVMGGPAGRRGPGAVAGKPRPPAGTFGFASRGGGGTPALQQTAASARMQAMKQAAAPRAAPAARPAGPAALAQPRGQSIAQRIGGRQGPPARRGGMARALGSGGSRRRMLR